MRNAFLAAVSMIGLGLVGCIGDVSEMPVGPGPGSDAGPGPGPGPSNAKPNFDANVYGILKAKCIGCHSAAGPVGNVTGFVDPNAATAYSTIVGYQAAIGDFTAASAPVLTKVKAGHQGTSYTPAEITSITGWLDAEVAARSGGSGSGGTTPPPGQETPSAVSTRLLNQWSACMTIDDFRTAGMATAWGNLAAANGQQCVNCHTNGGEGFIATKDETLFFNVISSNRYYMLQYFTTEGLTTPATAKMNINKQSFLGVSQGQDPHRQHPKFDSVNNAGMAALQKFYDLTAAHVAADTTGTACGPSKLTN